MNQRKQSKLIHSTMFLISFMFLISVSFNFLQAEIRFNLEKCLDYIKTGVEAIIEDDVTSRFEAEELKSWNLLTRTNRHYEFISWKITVIWILGFIVRYFILMPLRVFVCFIGVSLIDYKTVL